MKRNILEGHIFFMQVELIYEAMFSKQFASECGVLIGLPCRKFCAASPVAPHLSRVLRPAVAFLFCSFCSRSLSLSLLAQSSPGASVCD